MQLVVPYNPCLNSISISLILHHFSRTRPSNNNDIMVSSWAGGLLVVVELLYRILRNVVDESPQIVTNVNVVCVCTSTSMYCPIPSELSHVDYVTPSDYPVPREGSCHQQRGESNVVKDIQRGESNVVKDIQRGESNLVFRGGVRTESRSALDSRNTESYFWFDRQACGSSAWRVQLRHRMVLNEWDYNVAPPRLDCSCSTHENRPLAIKGENLHGENALSNTKEHFPHGGFPHGGFTKKLHPARFPLLHSTPLGDEVGGPPQHTTAGSAPRFRRHLFVRATVQTPKPPDPTTLSPVLLNPGRRYTYGRRSYIIRMVLIRSVTME